MFQATSSDSRGGVDGALQRLPWNERAGEAIFVAHRVGGEPWARRVLAEEIPHAGGPGPQRGGFMAASEVAGRAGETERTGAEEDCGLAPAQVEAQADAVIGEAEAGRARDMERRVHRLRRGGERGGRRDRDQEEGRCLGREHARGAGTWTAWRGWGPRATRP